MGTVVRPPSLQQRHLLEVCYLTRLHPDLVEPLAARVEASASHHVLVLHEPELAAGFVPAHWYYAARGADRSDLVRLIVHLSDDVEREIQVVTHGAVTPTRVFLSPRTVANRVCWCDEDVTSAEACTDTRSEAEILASLAPQDSIVPRH